MTKDFEIASKVRLKPIREVAGGLGLSPERLMSMAYAWGFLPGAGLMGWELARISWVGMPKVA
ncbi:MAG: hypothetical protein SVK44_08685 [Nitrospirota bacterium]|nr:hypothetical protein [Nitrospirota bacterium]